MASMYWVRHGQTALNVGAERIRGWADVPLDAKGVEQAHILAEKLPRVAAIYTSNLVRATYTAATIAAKQSLPEHSIHEMVELRPWNVGRYTGKPVEEVRAKLAKAVQDPTIVVPEGESFTDFVLRLNNALKLVTHVALAAKAPIVVVTHTRDIRVMLEWVENGICGVLSQNPSVYLSAEKDPVDPGHFVKLDWKGYWKAEDKDA